MGTLVNRKNVLTAEHCVEGEELPYTAIIAGSTDFRAGIKYSLFWWLTYDWWVGQIGYEAEFQFNDIAVLRVNNQLTYMF
jgi:hypothetical protein